MATSMFSISGLASGLDTSSIISQLMSIERIPLTRYQQQQTSLKKVDDAWSVITTRLSALRTALDGLDRPDDYAKHVGVASSDATVVTAAKAGTPATGSLSFTVDRLATTHQVAVGEALSGSDALVGAGTFSVQMADGTTKSVSTSSTTTLSDLKDMVNALKDGLSATIVQTSPGSFRLVVSASESGAASAFTVTQTPPGLDNAQTAVLTQGVDAQLTIGSGGGAMTVTRASNTVTDLMDGVTLTLNKTSATAVTVTTSRDVTATKKAITDAVDAFTQVFATIADHTKYDPESKTGGVLQGSSEARRIASDLRTALMTPLSGGTYTSITDLGVSFDRYGALQFDEAKLSQALESDYDGVISALSQLSGSATDSRVTYVTATSSTANGTYDVTITQTADVARAFSAAYTRPVDEANPHEFRVTSGATSVDVTLTFGTDVDLATAVDSINTQLTAGGLTNIRAVADAGTIRLEESTVGSSVGFTVTNTGTTTLWTTQTVWGRDVKGRFGSDPTEFTGEGTVLTASSGDASGLSVDINLPAGSVVPASLGTVTVSRGLIGTISDTLETMEGRTGRVQATRDGLSAQIQRLTDSIEAFELRLEQRETTLRRKFAALESALARSQSQGMWIASQIGAMTANQTG